MNARRFAVTTLALLVASAGPGLRFALADAPDAGADSASASASASTSGADALQEIVVVGQKQNINLQNAPIAITAITADTLAQANVVMPLDLNGQVPGLVITQSEGYNRSVSIRGIGFNVPQDDSAQTSVSYHEDGIYIAFPVALDSGFLDVDHVEVLRGPQGTVFGQNAIGGTINVISKLPSFDGVNGYVDASTGSYSLAHVGGALNVPLGDTLAVRGAFDLNDQKGYVKAIDVPGDPGYDLNNQHNWHARLQALWRPMDDLSVLLRAEYAKADQHETSGKNILDPVADPYQQSSDWPGRMIYDQQLAGATIDYNFSAATLKVISSYQEVDHHGSVNEDGLSYALQSPSFTPHDVEWFEHNSRSITEEINLTSKPGGVVDWIVGAFYLQSTTTVAYDQYNLFPGYLTLNGDPAPDLINVGSLDNGPVGTFLVNDDLRGTALLPELRHRAPQFSIGIRADRVSLQRPGPPDTRRTLYARPQYDLLRRLLRSVFPRPLDLLRRDQREADLARGARLRRDADQPAVRQRLDRLQAGRRQYLQLSVGCTGQQRLPDYSVSEWRALPVPARDDHRL